MAAYFQRKGVSVMARPVIFTISAAWDDEASVWTGHCDDIPAAADAPTLDELLAKISAMALDLLPERAGCRVNGTAIRQGAARGAGWFPEHGCLVLERVPSP
jgi:hypothetical protein